MFDAFVLEEKESHSLQVGCAILLTNAEAISLPVDLSMISHLADIDRLPNASDELMISRVDPRVAGAW